MTARPDLRPVAVPEPTQNVRGASAETEAINRAAEIAVASVLAREDLAARLHRAEASLEMANMKISKLEHERSRLEAERDHFMSRCAENAQLINNISAMVVDAARAAQDGPFGKAQAQRPAQVRLMDKFEESLGLKQDDGRPIPAFLTQADRV